MGYDYKQVGKCDGDQGESRARAIVYQARGCFWSSGE